MTESVAMQRNKKKQQDKRSSTFAMAWIIPLALAVWIVPFILMWIYLPEKAEYLPTWEIKLSIVLGWLAITSAFVKAFYGLSKQPTAFDSIQAILQKHYGGVYKRIDENRELLELIQEKAPEFLKENSWVEGWLQSQDGFLSDLARTVPEDAKLPRFNSQPVDTVTNGSRPYPRPWPGKQ